MSAAKNGVSNRLIHEKSPYLLQHAHNPVDWYPWGIEAFEKAAKENKPVFLSIGYSTCHWCHVMERESFEDKEVAEKLNKSFIAVKVDREERPDIDHTYMTFCQALTGAGGWPLTILMTPDKKPFFAGTYFAKNSGGGRVGLIDVLDYTSEKWKNEKEKILTSAEELYTVVSSHYGGKDQETVFKKEGLLEEVRYADARKQTKDDIMVWGKQMIEKGYEMLAKTFDPKFGGFGHAPKFPSPHTLGFLMRCHLDRPDQNALEMVRKTLDLMADGGIYDQIGYGFSRYSTDRFWLVPHFEKMLYDNATLAYTYLEAYQLTHEQRYGQVAREIFSYVLREMCSPEGGFYSAEDADSEGEEGKYYIWTYQEVMETLTAELLRIQENRASLDQPDGRDIFQSQFAHPDVLPGLYCEAYQITKEGNFEGKNILNRLFSDWRDLARKASIPFDEFVRAIRYCNTILLRVRERRVRPIRDDKILVSWNGLMIAALAKGAQVLSFPDQTFAVHENASLYLTQAEKAANFIDDNMRSSDGRLFARYRHGEAQYPAYLDDYAFYIFGLLELYTACGKPVYLQRAIELQQQQENLFRDTEKGGYFFTGKDSEELLFRPKEVYDGALPSGNSLAVLNLTKLWKMTGDNKWKNIAEGNIQSFHAEMKEYPAGHLAFLRSIQHYISDGDELILGGALNNEVLNKMKEVFFRDFRPYAVLLYHEGTVQELVPELAGYPQQEKAAAYLCRNFSCLNPVFSVEELQHVLRS